MAIVILTIDNFDSANSFVEIAEATTYHDNRGNTSWSSDTYTNIQREQALIRTYDFIWTLRFRHGVFEYEIPQAIKNAQIEGALRELLSPGCLLPDLSKDDFVTKKVIVGAIETTYADGARTVYQKMMAILKPYLAISRQRRLVRG